MRGPVISIVIANWNTERLLLQCLESIYASNTPFPVEVIVIDNGSKDNSVNSVRASYPQVRLVLNDENRGFARASNQGIRAARGTFVVLLNTDTIVRKAAFDKLVAFMGEHPECGLAAPKIVSPQGEWISKPKPFHVWWHDAFWVSCYLSDLDPERLLQRARRGARRTRAAEAATPRRLASDSADYFKAEGLIGCCLMARRATIDAIGLLNENFFFYGEDIDWCKRAVEGGWVNYCFTGAEVTHLGGESSKTAYLGALDSYIRSLIYYHWLHTGSARARLLQVVALGVCAVNWIGCQCVALLRHRRGCRPGWLSFYRRMCFSLSKPDYALPSSALWRPQGM